jgi:hypothetical protein
VATWDDVDRLASILSEASKQVSPQGLANWKVKGKGFAWERPLRRADHEALGGNAPEGGILGIMVPDLVAREALISDDPTVYFTTPHFDGYRAVLVQLDHIDVDELEEVLVEAWLAQAPKRLAKECLNEL